MLHPVVLWPEESFYYAVLHFALPFLLNTFSERHKMSDAMKKEMPDKLKEAAT